MRAEPPTLLAALLDRPGRPLRLSRVPRPRPGPGRVLLRVLACGVCRTDLHAANDALEDLRAGRLRGAAVLIPPGVGGSAP